MKALSEQDIKNSIMDFIILHPQYGFAGVIDNVGIYDVKKKCFRTRSKKYKIPGMSDIQGVWTRRPLYIEVKKPGGKLSIDQIAFLELAARHEAIAFAAWSVDQAILKLRSYIHSACP